MTQSVEQLEKKVRALRKELNECKKERERLRQTAEYDFLTGVCNRHGFVREAGRFLHELRSERTQGGRRRSSIVKNVSIIFIDVDDLKKVNDKLGHDQGDRYIKAVARVLAKHVRSIDVVGRWGGDEFVVALINTRDRDALAVAQKLHRKIAAIKLAPGFTCSASLGIVSAVDAEGRMQYGLAQLIEQADKAMYEAKTTKGKGAIVSFLGSA